MTFCDMIRYDVLKQCFCCVNVIIMFLFTSALSSIFENRSFLYETYSYHHIIYFQFYLYFTMVPQTILTILEKRDDDPADVHRLGGDSLVVGCPPLALWVAGSSLVRVWSLDEGRGIDPSNEARD